MGEGIRRKSGLLHPIYQWISRDMSRCLETLTLEVGIDAWTHVLYLLDLYSTTLQVNDLNHWCHPYPQICKQQ
jgi:hypothetical protein